MKRQHFIQAKEEEIIHEFVKLYGEDQRERLEKNMREVIFLFPDSQVEDKEKALYFLCHHPQCFNSYPKTIAQDILRQPDYTFFYPLILKKHNQFVLQRLIIVHKEHETDAAILHELKHALMTQLEIREQRNSLSFISLKTGLSITEHACDEVSMETEIYDRRKIFLLNELLTEYDASYITNQLHQYTEIFPDQQQEEPRYTWQHNFFELLNTCPEDILNYFRELELMNPTLYLNRFADEIEWLNAILQPENLEIPVQEPQKQYFLKYINYKKGNHLY